MTTPADPPGARERLLAAVADLIGQQGVGGVSTRAVCELAEVGAPTLYHHFGSKQGLLDAAADQGFERYLAAKASHPGSGDAVADVAAGWDAHVRFGLENPSLYALMHGQTRPGWRPPAAERAEAMLLALFARAAAEGRLSTTPARASAVLLAANVGVTLSLVASPAAARDTGVADDLRDAVLQALTTPAPGATAGEAEGVSHGAARLRRAIRGGAGSFSPQEAALLDVWLARLGASGSHA